MLMLDQLQGCQLHPVILEMNIQWHTKFYLEVLLTVFFVLGANINLLLPSMILTSIFLM